ncbi:MAG: YdjY domain-containing protein [Planctomycetota bacterium]|nr:YdjY domain-containing protein [Planctomycetota bacterium]
MRRFPAVSLLFFAACTAVEPSSGVATAPNAPVESAGTLEPVDELLASLGVKRTVDGKALEVQGWVNMNSGVIEVLACAPEGKLHESLLVLDCVPSGLHAGLMALGLQPGTPGRVEGGGEFKPPTGERVAIELRWVDANGVERRTRPEDWLWDAHSKQTMPRQDWIYAGSFEVPIEGRPGAVSLAADAVKSLAVTYHDATTLLQLEGLQSLDDTTYEVNSPQVPPKGTPVVVVFTGVK